MADADGCDDAGLLGGPELQPVTTEKGRVYSAGIFSRRTNQTQEAWVYSHNGPTRRRKRGYILMMNQSDAGSVT
eukprot:8390888-Pyramimonas_sp.AAC.1